MKLPLVGAILFALCFPVFAGPPGAPPDEFMEKAEELAQWIDDNSDFGPMTRHPAYVFLPFDKLQYTFFVGNGMKYPSEGGYLIAAAYLDGIMFLPDTFDLQSNENMEKLLHELVHHLQFIEGRRYPCNAAAEREAYDLADLWRAAHDMPPALDPVSYFFVTTCPARP